jgi:hypothetical protein
MIFNKKRSSPPLLPFMVAELALASWETVFRRSMMIAQGSCSVTEYQRMILEKTRAAHLSVRALANESGDMTAALAPWHSRAVANAKRLRPK